MRALQVPDANSEKEFLINALAVWLTTHGKPVPSNVDLTNQIFYYPTDQGNDVLTLEDERVSEDGA